MRYFEARTLIITGLTLTAGSLFQMTGWTDLTQVPEIVTVSVIQGFGFGLVFVPLSTVAFLTLPNNLRTDGTAMLTLMRNVASSVGISVVIAELTQGTRRTYAILSEHINPFNHALQMPDVRGMRATLRLSSPAWLAQPKKTSSTWAQSRLGCLAISALIGAAARSSARTLASEPPKRPIGVRTASQIKTSRIVVLPECRDPAKFFNVGGVLGGRPRQVN